MKKSLLSGIALVASLMVCSAPAQADVIDLGELEVGKTYEMKDFTEVCATFTPSSSEPVKFVYYNSCSPFDVYTDEKHKREVTGSYSTTGSSNIYTYDLKEGTKYYLYVPFVWQGGTFAIETGKTTLDVIGVIPELADGQKFSVSEYSTMSVRFNSPVRVGTAVLQAGGQSAVVSAEVHQGTFVDVVVNQKLMQLYRSGAIGDGSEITLVLNDVADDITGEKYNGTGVAEVKFTMAAKPAEVVKKNFIFSGNGANILKSYYFPGDPDAVAVIEFDTPLDDTFNPNPTGTEMEVEIAKGYIPMAKFKYGNEEDPDIVVYQEEVIGKVEGNKVSFDLSGVRRRKLDMLPGASSDKLDPQLGIYYKNMRSADGQRVYTGSTTNFVGFWATYTIWEINCSISCEFSPAEGSALKYGSPLEIWVGSGSNIRFDGVAFEYTANGSYRRSVVPYGNLTVETDPDDSSSRIYTVTVPNLNADKGTEITVSLENMLCADGFDHSADVVGTFKDPSSASGVGSIEAEDAPADVYDVTGRCVLRNASQAQIRDLDRGIYIVNGRKIVK